MQNESIKELNGRFTRAMQEFKEDADSISQLGDAFEKIGLSETASKLRAVAGFMRENIEYTRGVVYKLQDAIRNNYCPVVVASEKSKSIGDILEIPN